MKKKIALLPVLAMTTLVLAACGEELVNENDIGRDLDIKTENLSNEAIIKAEKERKYTTLVSTFEVDNNEFEVETKYGIDSRFADDWMFTYVSDIDLSTRLTKAHDQYDVKVAGVYSDVSVISQLARTNGLRQDSINLDYHQSPYSITTDTAFSVPFQVEGINANQLSVSVYYGYGSGSTSRITEDQIKDRAVGARLTTVWYYAVTNKDTDETFMVSVNDKVPLKIKSVDTSKKK